MRTEHHNFQNPTGMFALKVFLFSSGKKVQHAETQNRKVQQFRNEWSSIGCQQGIFGILLIKKSSSCKAQNQFQDSGEKTQWMEK